MKTTIIAFALALLMVAGCSEQKFVNDDISKTGDSTNDGSDAGKGLTPGGVNDIDNGFSQFVNKLCNQAARLRARGEDPGSVLDGQPVPNIPGGPNNASDFVNKVCNLSKSYEEANDCKAGDEFCLEEAAERAAGETTGAVPPNTWAKGNLLDDQRFSGVVRSTCDAIKNDPDYKAEYEANCTGKPGTVTENGYSRSGNTTSGTGTNDGSNSGTNDGSGSNGGTSPNGGTNGGSGGLISTSTLGDCDVDYKAAECLTHEQTVGKTCADSVDVDGGEITDEMCKGRQGSTFESACNSCMQNNGGKPELCKDCGNRKFGVLISDKIRQAERGNDMVDILWVLDNSASMIEEHQRIADNFENYIEKLAEAKIDFHLAVILTDVRKGGDFISKVFTSETPNLKQEFTKIVARVGNPDDLLCASNLQQDYACYLEQGLNTAMLALKKAEAGDAPNKNFLRKDAKLSIIIVSDDDDLTQGENATGPTGDRDRMVRYFKGLKSDASMVKISSFVADGSDGCKLSNWKNGNFVETADNIERVGRLYMKASRDTDGYIAPICDSDFVDILDSLGYDSIGLKHRFKLTSSADPFSIIVKVGGVLVPRSRKVGWTYNDETLEIEFHGDAIPKANAEVVISYYKKK